MAKYIYPAIFSKETNGYSVNFPDLESCYTQGDNLHDAHDMAQDVLCLTLYHLEKSNAPIPAPSNVKDFPIGNDSTVSLISCDTSEYQAYF